MSDIPDAFTAAVQFQLILEGGLADDVADPGGITHFGISLAYAKSLGASFLDVNHDGVIDADDIRAMPVNTAIDAYHAGWWNHYRLGSLPLWAGCRMLWIGTNMGMVPVTRCLQTAVGANPIDGRLGPQTIAKAVAADPRVVTAFQDAVWAEYAARMDAHPQLAKFAGGWKRRAYL